MPGARLTYRDRHRIASGLAGGLAYAEIARRLDRPTSTVTREVARNGGPADYDPGRAHQATQRRARRGTPAAVPVPSADSVATREFAEQFVALLVRMGIPRMAARVLVCLYTTDAGSRTAAELSGLLRVSPAAVSKAIGYLERLGLVGRRRERGERRERYVVDDVWFQSSVESARTNARLADAVARGAAVFGADTPTGARLTEMSQVLHWLAEQEARISNELRATFGR